MMAPESIQRARSASSGHRLSLARIEEAAALIDPAFMHSPMRRTAALGARFGCELTLKDETTNPVGCFKGRGAQHFVSRLMVSGARTPLVCASAGNFGLAMAHACAAHGLALTVFVAENASPVKVDGIRRYGAHIVAVGRDFDAAKHAARAYAQDRRLQFVEDGAEPAISEGAALIARELLAAATYDAMLVPLGNGALLAGMARWVKAHAPATEMIGVCTAGAPVMYEALQGAEPSPGMQGAAVDERTADTIADGIAVRIAVSEAVEDLRPLIDDVLLVRDPQLLAAMRMVHETEGLICEPAAVAGVAALAADRARFAGRRVATVLTGRNLTQQQIGRWFN